MCCWDVATKNWKFTTGKFKSSRLLYNLDNNRQLWDKGQGTKRTCKCLKFL